MRIGIFKPVFDAIEHVRNTTSFWLRDEFLANQSSDKQGLTSTSVRKKREIDAHPSPSCSPGSTVRAEAWHGQVRPCSVGLGAAFRLEGKLRGEASPPPLSCLSAAFPRLESLCCYQISEPVPLGGGEADGAPDGRDVCRHGLAGFISRIPSWREGWREVRSSSTVIQCHSVTSSHQLGKAGSLSFCPGVAGVHLPQRSIRAGPGCPGPPHNSYGAGNAPSKPVLTYRGSEQTWRWTVYLCWNSGAARSQFLCYTF